MKTLMTNSCIPTLSAIVALAIASPAALADYDPPSEVPVADIKAASDEVLARPDIPVKGEKGWVEDIIRFEVAGMEWDIGMSVHEPADPADIARGADGRKIGIFLLHGGSGDFKSMHRQARILSQKFGYKVVSMSYPGRHAFNTESRDWPGKNANDDGSVRTPIWLRGETIGPDQYEVIFDTGQRPRYGTRRLAKAKPGTTFYYRMAAWPLALEAGGIKAMQKHFPADEFSVYLHGHSTGGPLVNMLSQRVANVAGMLAVENSSFGYIYRAQSAWGGQLGKIGEYDLVQEATQLPSRSDPFDELYIRSWRDSARYVGPELLGTEGPEALMRLPMVMEDILDDWDRSQKRPQFKAEYVITHGITDSLTEAARVTAARMELDESETQALVDHYIGLTVERSGDGVRPVPPVMFQISAHSRDHSREVYEEVVIPLYEAMDPPPKYSLTQFMAGKHGYMARDDELGLPYGIGPAVFTQWDRAIRSGWFVTDKTR
jgi:predicted alpha/beta hydrolase family esterase